MKTAEEWCKQNGYDPDEEVMKPKTGGGTTKLKYVLELYHNQKMEEIMPELFDWIIIFVQKARVVDDPRLDRLFELDDLYQKVYSDNRIRHDFFIAAQMAYMAVFNEIFKSFLKQEEK